MIFRLITILVLSGFFTTLTFAEFSNRAHSVPTIDTKPYRFKHSSDDINWSTRNTLTRDWGGARSSLADKGMIFDIRHTTTYQELISGTRGDDDTGFGNKVDAFITLNSEKLGLWEGGALRVHLDYSYGDTPSSFGGAIFATNTMLYWPGNTDNELEATSLFYAHKMSDTVGLAVGKFNPVDTLASSAFYGGWGIDRFMNLILVAPPSGLIPVVFMGVFVSIKTKPIAWTIMVYDPEDRTSDYFPDDLFSEGVNIYVSGAYATIFDGRKTTIMANALYSTAEGTDYSMLQPGYYPIPTKEGSYNLSVEIKHILQEEGMADWGVYFKATVADGNPNYV